MYILIGCRPNLCSRCPVVESGCTHKQRFDKSWFGRLVACCGFDGIRERSVVWKSPASCDFYGRDSGISLVCCAQGDVGRSMLDGLSSPVTRPAWSTTLLTDINNQFHIDNSLVHCLYGLLFTNATSATVPSRTVNGWITIRQSITWSFRLSIPILANSWFSGGQLPQVLFPDAFKWPGLGSSDFFIFGTLTNNSIKDLGPPLILIRRLDLSALIILPLRFRLFMELRWRLRQLWFVARFTALQKKILC